MNIFKGKYFFSLAFLAASFFLSIALGGEYFHERIHHHATQEEHDECPLYQLAVQLILFVMTFTVMPLVFPRLAFCRLREVQPLRLRYSTSQPRAPPLVF